MSGEGTGGERIDRFLACRELDDLEALAVPYGSQSPAERAAVSAALARGGGQAVANVLMVPAVIAPGEHFAALERALGEESSYVTLAAIVGLHDVDRSTMIEHQAAWITRRLLDLCAGADRIIAEQASVALSSFADLSQLGPIVALVDADLEVVRHNAVVALLAIFGPVRSARLLRHHVDTRATSVATGDLVRTALVALEQSASGGRVAGFDRPLLGDVPNLDEWSGRASSPVETAET